MIKKILVIYLLICSTAVFGAATNHYIRDGASGDGSDWTNAWDDLPATFVRGDTYYVADGNYGTHVFEQAESGSTYIYIKKAIVSDHGTDIGWQTSYGDGQAVFVMQTGGEYGGLLFNAGYYIFDGQVGGSPGSWNSGHGFKLTGPEDKNLHDFALMRFGDGWAGNVKTDNLEIKHTEFTLLGYREYHNSEPGDGIRQHILWQYESGNNGPHNVVISHNYIHDVSMPLNSAYCENWTVQYNYFARNDVIPAGSNQGAGWQDFGSDNMVVRYNIFEDIDGTANIDMKGGQNEDNYSGHNNWAIYGNIFFHTEGSAVYGTGGNGVITVTGWGEGHLDSNVTNMSVYNNAFININANANTHGWGAGVTFYTDIPDNETNNVVYNNIWYNCNARDGGGSWFVGVSSHNYNWYYGNTRGGSNYDADLVSFETNSQLGPGNPFTNKDANDFTLTAETDAGTNLGSPYNIDLLGNTRTDWTRGAYEYVSGEPPAGCACPCRSLD